MSVSRRWFIGGLVSAGAVGAHRLFAVPGGSAAGARPNLRVGVVSDVHVRLGRNGVGFAEGYGTETLRAAFEYFRDQRVDAVVLPGDMADSGLVGELRAVAETWFSVFPDDKGADGRRVERVFTLGNHDWHGTVYGDQVYPEKGDRCREAICQDGPRFWRETFHEDLRPAFMKTVNGYPFFGAHWVYGGQCVHADEHGCDVFADFFAANVGKADPARPFFFVQHPHPKDTCYGPWAWGHDNGAATRALSPHPNAIALSGHSHYPLTDERSIWQGAFTSLGCGCLRYASVGSDEFAPAGFENGGASKGPDRNRLNAVKMMKGCSGELTDCRNGLLVDVFDDRVVFARRDFVYGLSLGPDWVMPIGDERPFAFARRAKAARAPAFPAGAALEFRRVTATNRGAGKLKAEVKAACELTIPCADAEPSARAYRYDVTAVGASGRKVFRVAATGSAYSIDHPKAHAPLTFRVAADRCPADLVRFDVEPVSCWGVRGQALSVRS